VNTASGKRALSRISLCVRLSRELLPDSPLSRRSQSLPKLSTSRIELHRASLQPEAAVDSMKHAIERKADSSARRGEFDGAFRRGRLQTTRNRSPRLLISAFTPLEFAVPREAWRAG
jgi:hypothetical protein